MARHLLAAVLAVLFAGSAFAGHREDGAPARALAEPAATPGEESEADGSSAPASVASLDPIEEHASVAPRAEKIRHLPVTRALEQDLVARRGESLPPSPSTARPRSGCAEVARWCLAHATSTSTP